MAREDERMKMTDSTSCSGAVVGIEPFLNGESSRTVVHGAIKSSPEDFVVREISADDMVVGFSDDSERVPTESEREAVVQSLAVARTAVQKEKKERLVFPKPTCGWKAALEELVGAQKVSQVAAVADFSASECFLDSPTDFKARVYLQVCIQNCFPGLDCKISTVPARDNVPEQQQVQVLLDPVYKKFRDGGMAQINCDRLMEFLRKGASDPTTAKGLELEHEDTKEARTVLHRLISKNSSCFRTKTETRDGVQKLVVQFSQKNNKKRKRSQQEPRTYLRFVLQKTNQEHFACFDKLSRLLSRPLSAFSYAGTKDKTAITFQHVVVSGVSPQRLLSINSGADEAANTGIRVGDLAFVGAPMTLGSAKGNRFCITIRELSSQCKRTSGTIQSALETAMESVKRCGFVNYFGFQRVGLPTSAVRPHHIGEKILAGKWEEALRLLLAPGERDSEDTARAKRIYLDTGDAEAALKLLPFSMAVERQVLQGLKRHGADEFEQAVNCVPFSRRVMFLHSYQSYLFNLMASHRLRHLGSKLVAGDLIQGDASESGDGASMVKSITAEEASVLNSKHEAPLTLVLLPLVGTNVLLPSNSTKEACIKVMEQDGTKTALCEAGPVKGAYRPLVAFPREMQWAWEGEQQQSLQLSFSLSAGCFATMCLREVLGSDV